VRSSLTGTIRVSAAANSPMIAPHASGEASSTAITSKSP
jgi:hypothetical protein